MKPPGDLVLLFKALVIRHAWRSSTSWGPAAILLWAHRPRRARALRLRHRDGGRTLAGRRVAPHGSASARRARRRREAGTVGVLPEKRHGPGRPHGGRGEGRL